MSEKANVDFPVEDENEFSASSDGEDYNEKVRTSEDVRRRDIETLTGEEEAERLLGGGGTQDEKAGLGLGRRLGDAREARRMRRREARREKRRRKRGGRGTESEEEREMLYDMETGRRDSSSEGSSEVELHGVKETSGRTKTGRAKRAFKFISLHTLLIAVFLAFLYGAYRTTTHLRSHNTSYTPQTLSNGTHTFLPTTLLISLDGFRADFLNRNLTPTLNAFIRSGISPRYMSPVFPSLTFPNHFTLVTGLHPESHGVVGNTFWDPQVGEEFYYTDPDRSMKPEWWNAEPIWERAELAGMRSAIHMWPGSEAHIGGIEPAYVDHFNGHERLDVKVDRILSWLDIPGPQDSDYDPASPRPQFIAAYVPNVDQDGHKYGPNSTHIRSTLREVDAMLGSLFHGLGERNLTSILNIIVVSDHGMATTSTTRLIQLEDLLDPSLIEHTDGWPLYGLRPFNQSQAHLDELFASLYAKSQLPHYREAFDVYLRDKTMPEHFHFTQNARIAPLWIVPRAGWAIVPKNEFDIPAALAQTPRPAYAPAGLHGYDPEHPLMRAIFVARGPAFPHAAGSRVGVLRGTDVYGIVCDSLGLEPGYNNGTVRLPMRVEGVHDFDSEMGGLFGDVTSVQDWPDDEEDGDVGGLLDHADEGAFGVLPPVLPDLPTQPEQPSKSAPPIKPGEVTSRPVVDHGDEDGEEKPGPDENFGAWLAWVAAQLEAIKWWTSGIFGHHQNGTTNGTAAVAEDGGAAGRARL